MECSRRLFLKKCGCQPYFYPIRGKDMKVCGIHDVDCSFDASKMAQMLAFPSSSVEIELNELGLSCSCPSSCNEVIYSIETSSAPYPSEMAFQSETIQKTVAKGKGEVDLRFLQEETSLVHVFFKNEFIIQYKRDTLYGFNDFISNIGGLMGLCMGFSLLSAIEIVYWFLVRWFILVFRRKEPQTRSTHQMHLTANKPKSAITGLDSNLAKKQAFDELFDKR